MVFGIEDAARRAAGAILPRLDAASPVLTVLPHTAPIRVPPVSAFRAAMKMIKTRSSCLVVTEQDSSAMLGLVTLRDFVHKLRLEPAALKRASVTDLMTSDVVSLSAEHTLQQCVDQMRERRVRHVPVKEGGEVKTVIAMREIGLVLRDVLGRRDVAEGHLSVGDMMAEIRTPALSVSLPETASVADALGRMRAYGPDDRGIGALLVLGSGGAFGIFTERDYVHNVLPCCVAEDTAPADVPLGRPTRWATPEEGHSRRFLQALAADAALADAYRPDTITCVERDTPVRDCLQLMLGNRLSHVPVIENDKPVDIVSMRDINLFLAPDSASSETAGAA